MKQSSKYAQTHSGLSTQPSPSHKNLKKKKTKNKNKKTHIQKNVKKFEGPFPNSTQFSVNNSHLATKYMDMISFTKLSVSKRKLRPSDSQLKNSHKGNIKIFCASENALHCM